MRKCRAAPVDEFDGDPSDSPLLDGRGRRTVVTMMLICHPPKLRLRRVSVEQMGLGMGNSARSTSTLTLTLTEKERRRSWSRSGMFRVLVFLPPPCFLSFLCVFCYVECRTDNYAQGIEYVKMRELICHKYLTVSVPKSTLSSVCSFSTLLSFLHSHH